MPSPSPPCSPARHGNSAPRALQLYEQVRREQAARVQRSSRFNGALYEAAKGDLDARDQQLAAQRQSRAYIWNFDAEAEAAEGGEIALEQLARIAVALLRAARKSLNTMSGDEVLWREGETRPAHTSVAVARLKAMMPSSRQPLAPFSRTAMRATSLLNSVTYMERSAANGRPSIGRSKATSSALHVLIRLGHRHGRRAAALEGQRESLASSARRRPP